MPEDVSGTPEELDQQGFSTKFEPQEDYFSSYLKSLPPPPPKPSLRDQRQKAYDEFAPTGGELGAGVARGLVGAGESAAGVGEVVSSAVPVVGQFAKAKFKDVGDYLAEIAAQIPQQVPSVSDIETPGDVPKYTAEQLGSLAGFLAPSVVLGLLSGGTSTELQLGAKAGEMSIGLSKDLAHKLVTGGFIGSEIGGTYRGVRDATGVEAPLTSIVAGTASGLLLSSGALPLVKEFLDQSTGDIKRQFVRGYLADVVNAAGRHGAFLGGASAGSHSIHLLANKWADKNYELVNSQNLIGITDSFLAGIIGGGAIGGAGRAMRGPGGAAPEVAGEVAPISPEVAESGLRSPVGEGVEAPSPVDIFLARDRARQAEANRAAEQAAVVQTAVSDAATNLSKAAEISAVQANAAVEAHGPIAEAIATKPSEPVPSESVAAADRAMEQASAVAEQPAYPPGSAPPDAGMAAPEKTAPVPEKPVLPSGETAVTSEKRIRPEGERPAVLSAREDLSVRGPEVFDDEVTKITKGKNDAGQTVYAIRYERDGKSRVGYSDDPAWEGHAKYREEPSAESIRGSQTEPTAEGAKLETGEKTGGNVVEQKPSGQPEPVEPGKQTALPKPTPAERKVIAQQAADLKRFTKEVSKLHKQLEKMGPSEIDQAGPAFAGILAGFKDKVPADVLDRAIVELSNAVQTRRKVTNPDVNGLLVDRTGGAQTANIFYDPKTQQVLIRAGDKVAYRSKKKFASMAAFEKVREELLSDGTHWTRDKNGGAWLFHDAPIKASDRDTWAAGLIYHLRKINKPIAEVIEKVFASEAMGPDDIVGLIGAKEHIEKGAAKRFYPNRLTPSEAAEALPDIIKREIEKDYKAAKVEPLDPELAGDDAARETHAQKLSVYKLLEKAHKLDPEALQQWLLSKEIKRVEDNKELEDSDVKEVEHDETGETVEKEGGGGGSGVAEDPQARMTKFSDSVAGLFEKQELGTKAGDLTLLALTDGATDATTFTAKLGDLFVQEGFSPEKSASTATGIYDIIDKMRSEFGFRGRLSEGLDHTPQTSSEKPIAHASAVGARAISDLVNDTRYGLSEQMRQFTNQFLAQVDPMYLDGLTLEAVSHITPDGKSHVTYQGTFEPLLRIAKVALNSRNPDVIAHEISHNLYYYLPEAMRERVNADWVTAVEAQIARETDPAAIQMLREALRRGGIQSPLLGMPKGTIIDVLGPDGKTYKVRFDGAWDWTALGKGIVPQITAMEDIPGVTIKGSSHVVATLEDKGVKFPADVLGKAAAEPGWADVNTGQEVTGSLPFYRLYHLTHPEEYFVHKLLEKTLERSSTGVWQYAKDFIRQLMDTFKRVVGLNDAPALWDSIADGFRNGDFENRYQVWAKQADVLGSVSRKASDFAKNIERAPTAAKKLTEAVSALAQNLTLSRVASGIADTLGASARARKLAGTTEDVNVSTAAKDYTDPLTYHENRLRIGADTPQWRTIADDTFKKYRGRDIKLQKLRTVEEQQKAYIQSEEFGKKVAKKADLEGRITELREQQHETLKTTLAETIKANQKMLEQENLEEGKASQLRNEIAAIEAITKNKVGGLEQLINHIINVISLTPEGQALLLGGHEVKGSEFLKAYESIAGRIDAAAPGDLKFEVPHGDLELSDNEIRRLEKQANQLRRPSQALYSIAADMIARQRDVSQALAVAELVKNNPAIAQAYSEQFSPENLTKIRNNPEGFAQRIGNKLTAAGKKEGVISHAIAVLNKHLVTEINRIRDTRDAIKIIEETFKDPEVNSTYRQAAADSKQVVTPPVWAGKAARPDSLIQTRKFVLPDKSEIEVDFSVSSKVPAEYERVREAAAKIWDYINSEAGQSDPYLPYWQEQHRALFSIFASDVFLGIIKTHDPITFGFGEIRLTVPRIQTRQGNLATIAATNWDHAVKAFGHWILDHSERGIKLPLFEAARSHPELGKFQTAAEAVNAWKQQIGRELTGRPNAIGEGWRVGDRIGDGHTVTAEDLALLNSMVKSIDEAYSLTPQKGRAGLMVKQYVEDSLGTLREPLKKSPHLLPANFSREAINFARLVAQIRDGKDAEGMNAERLADLHRTFTEYFHDIIKPFLDDTEVLVDGGGLNFPLEAYRSAYERVKSGEIINFDGLVRHFTSYAIGDEIHSDWVAKRLTDEINRQAQTIYEATTGMNPDNRFIPLDSYNSFTLARGKRIANYGYYEYGLFDDIAIRNFADDGASFYFDRFRTSLDKAKEELAEMASRMEATSRGGMDGEKYREFQEIKAKLRDVNNLITSLDHAEGKFGRYQSLDLKAGRRVMNTLVTAAIANPITGMGDLSGNWIRTVEYALVMFGRQALMPKFQLAFAGAVAKGVVLALRGAGGAAVAGVREASKAGSAKERAARSFESAITAFAKEPWLAEMAKEQGKHAQFLREMAENEYFHHVDPVRVGNMFRAPATGGAIYDIKGNPESTVRKMANYFNGGMSVVGALVNAVADTVYRHFNVTGDLGISAISHIGLESIRLQLARTFENLGEDGLRRQFNLDRPSDPKNVVHASMIFWNGATNSNLSHFAELTKLAGFSHNEIAVDYWKRLAAAKPEARNDVPMLTPEQVAMFTRKMVEDINQPTVSNRSLWLKRTSAGRLLYPLMGWSVDAAGKSLHWFSRAASDPQRSVQQLRYMQLVTVAGLFAFAGASAMANEEVMRLMYKWLYNEVKPGGRQPWESDTQSGALKRTIIAMSTLVPVVNIIPNLLFNDTPGSASQGVDVFLQGKFKDFAGYFGGAIASGDPTYGLADLIRRTFPITRPFINATPGYAGVVELRNATRLLQRYAPEDIRRPSGGPSGATTATPLTPYGRRMANAAMSGDIDGLKKIYAEAVEKAKELGRDDPERVVQQLFESQSPIRSALKSAPSLEQWNAMVGRMSDGDRQIFEEALQKYQAGGEAIGVKVGFQKGASTISVSQPTTPATQGAASPGPVVSTAGIASAAGATGAILRRPRGRSRYGPPSSGRRSPGAGQGSRLRAGGGLLRGSTGSARSIGRRGGLRRLGSGSLRGLRLRRLRL